MPRPVLFVGRWPITCWRMRSFDPLSTFVDRMLKQIVGFRIEIGTIEGKWKLKQNHSVERRTKVVRALGERGDENARAVAAMMRATLPPCTATADGQERDERTVTHLDWI